MWGSRGWSALLSLPLSGWVTGLTTEPQKAEAGPGDEVRMSKETQSKVEALRYQHPLFLIIQCVLVPLMCLTYYVMVQVRFQNKSYCSRPGQSWSNCRSKSCRAVSSTSRPLSRAQLSQLCPSSASTTSSPSARTMPATASPLRCRLPSTICCSRSAH